MQQQNGYGNFLLTISPASVNVSQQVSKTNSVCDENVTTCKNGIFKITKICINFLYKVCLS